MKQRFATKEKNTGRRNLILTLVIFALVIGCFIGLWGKMTEKTSREELATLDKALARSIAHCYAIEGQYPESLEYLKENYGLVYDEKSFFVDYRPVAADIRPDYTIVPKDLSAFTDIDGPGQVSQDADSAGSKGGDEQ